MSTRLTTFVARFLRHQRAFACSEQGNIAVLFALASLPMLAFAGAAIDYTRAASARTAIQSALDSAALMIAKEAATSPDISTRGQQIFDSLYTDRGTSAVTVTTTYTPQNGNSPAKVTMSGSATIDTAFMQIFGFPSLRIGSSSTTEWGNVRLRVALALDTTGSMKDFDKIGILKTAAHNFVERLKRSATGADDLHVSVTPFTSMVKTDTAVSSSYVSWGNSGCLSNNICFVKQSSSWSSGCVTDRLEPDDIDGTSASGTRKFQPAVHYSLDEFGNVVEGCTRMTKLLPLTNDLTKVYSTLDALTAFGGTNQPIGLFWAWWTLRQNEPFKDQWTRDPDYKYITAIVLFTDGVNTIDRAYGLGNAYDSRIDDRQRQLCANIKADVMPNDGAPPKIYAIQVDTDGSGQQQVLKDCAGESQYFFLTSPAQIETAFTDIAAALTRLRISQ